MIDEAIALTAQLENGNVEYVADELIQRDSIDAILMALAIAARTTGENMDRLAAVIQSRHGN